MFRVNNIVYVLFVLFCNALARRGEQMRIAFIFIDFIFQ